MRATLAPILMVLLCAGACAPPPAPPAQEALPAAQATAPAYRPIVALNDMMVSIVDANSHHIWDAEEKAPQTDADWSDLEHAAVTLAAAGNLTMLSGNGANDQKWTQQADWAKHSMSLSDAGLAAVRAVRSRNLEGLRMAGDALVMSCIDCHREYKLDVPKIWSDHEGH